MLADPGFQRCSDHACIKQTTQNAQCIVLYTQNCYVLFLQCATPDVTASVAGAIGLSSGSSESSLSANSPLRHNRIARYTACSAVFDRPPIYVIDHQGYKY